MARKLTGQLQFPVNFPGSPVAPPNDLLKNAFDRPLQAPGAQERPLQSNDQTIPANILQAKEKPLTSIDTSFNVLPPARNVEEPLSGTGVLPPARNIDPLQKPILEAKEKPLEPKDTTIEIPKTTVDTGPALPKPTPTQPLPPKGPPTQTKPVENTDLQDANVTLDELDKAAGDALRATDDPISKSLFNHSLTTIGLRNQIERDMLQQRINNDPSLQGQPAGNAMLFMLARSQNVDVSDLLFNMNIESANRIRDLNTWGFDRSAQIVEFRETQKLNNRNELLLAGDFDGYSSQFQKDTGIEIDVSDMKELSPATQNIIATKLDLLNAALASGNVDEARAIFEQIQAISPKAFGDADFDTLGFADESYKLNAENQNQIQSLVRLDLAQGDTEAAIEGLKRLTTPEKRVELGQGIIDSNSIEDLNAMLEAAGFSPVTDKSELIGREEDLFLGKEISDMQKNLDRTIIDDGVDFFMSELGKINPGIMIDEEAQALIRGFVMDLNTGGSISIGPDGEVLIESNDLLEPWDENSNKSHMFFSWPMLDAEGNIIDGMERNPYTDSNPRPAPDTEMGQYMDDLDAKWENYLRETPASDRVVPEQWFFATQGGTEEFNPENIPGGIGPQDTGGGGTSEDAVTFAANFTTKTDEEVVDFLFSGGSLNQGNFDALVSSGFIQTVRSAKDLTPEFIDSIINDPTSRNIVNINGTPFMITEPNSQGFVQSPNGKPIPNLVKELDAKVNFEDSTLGGFRTPKITPLLSSNSLVEGSDTSTNIEVGASGLYHLIIEGPNAGKVADVFNDKIITMEQMSKDLEGLSEKDIFIKQLMFTRNLSLEDATAAYDKFAGGGE